MDELFQEIFNLICKMFHIDLGFIVAIDPNYKTADVKVNDTTIITCDLIFPNGHTDSDNKISWGDFSLPTKGDFVLIIHEGAKAYILKQMTGYKNIEDVYNSGKLVLNRIPDSDDNSLTSETELEGGEKFLRSVGFADLFLDQLGNILFDGSKEFVIRIGDRNGSNIINSPQTIMRIGRVKNGSGDQLQINGNDVVVDITNTGGASIQIDNAGNINFNQGTHAFVLGDILNTFLGNLITALNSHVHPVTAVGSPTGVPATPLTNPSGLLSSTIMGK